MTFEYLQSPDDPRFRSVLDIYHEAFDRASREPDERLALELRREYRLPFRFLLAISATGQVLGFARFCVLPAAGFSFLIHIAVAASARGNGLGREMLGQVISAAKPWPVVVEIDREGRVRDWYEGQGFSSITENYWQPALHDDTGPVGYALCASSPILDAANFVERFYGLVWKLPLDDDLVMAATAGAATTCFQT